MADIPGLELYEDMLKAYRATGIINGKDLQRLKGIDVYYHRELMKYVGRYKPNLITPEAWEMPKNLPGRRLSLTDQRVGDEGVDEFGRPSSGRIRLMRQLRSDVLYTGRPPLSGHDLERGAILRVSGDVDCVEIYDAFHRIGSTSTSKHVGWIYEEMLKCVCESGWSRLEDPLPKTPSVPPKHWCKVWSEEAIPYISGCADCQDCMAAVQHFD